MYEEYITTGSITIPTSALGYGYTAYTTSKPATISIPKRSEWYCEIFGTKDFTYRPLKGNEPNWFWRKMQYLCFGSKWIKGEYP